MPDKNLREYTRAEVLMWFERLPFEDKLRAFSFYGSFNEEAGGTISTLAIPDDQEAVINAFEMIKKTPIDQPEVDEALVRDALTSELLKVLDRLSDDSLSQLRRELEDSGLSAKNREEPAIQPFSDYSAERNNTRFEDIEKLLVEDLTVGGDALDRVFFYRMTSEMTPEEFSRLQESVREKVETFYAGVNENASEKTKQDTSRFIEKALNSWFRPWTRLAGEMESELDMIKMDPDRMLTPWDVETIARAHMDTPRFAPYKNKEMLGWIRNRCADNGLDYTLISKDLQYEGAADSFRKEYPEYLSSLSAVEYGRSLLSANPEAHERWAKLFKENSESFLAEGDSIDLVIGQIDDLVRWKEYEKDNLLNEIAKELNIKPAEADCIYRFLASEEIERLSTIKQQQNDKNMKKDIAMITIKPYDGVWTRPDVANDTSNIYIFTDNTDRNSGKRIIARDTAYYQKYGDGEHDLHFPTVTSAVIRGLDNALPVSTQRWYHDGAKGVSGRWNDSDIAEFREVVGKEFADIREEILRRAIDPTRTSPLTVYLPAGGDGFTGGQISAITEDRTPQIYSFVKEQSESLYRLAALYNSLFVDNKGETENMRQAALKALTLHPEDLSTSPQEYLVDMSREELKSVLLHVLPLLPDDEWRMANVILSGATETQNEVVKKEDMSALLSYSAYQLSKLMNEVVFPSAGTDAAFDAALKQINDAMGEGWTKDRSEEQIKSYLLNLIGSLPESVQTHIAEAATTGKVNLKKDVFDDKTFDAYTVGFSTKSMDEFLSALPGRTAVLIDARERTFSKFSPQFNSGNLKNALSQQGIELVHISGSDPDFISKVRQIVLDNPGKVVIASTKSSPSKCERGLTWGPMLERSGISIGHISQAFDMENKKWDIIPSVSSQEEVTMKLLPNMEITGGSYKNITFREDGTILEMPGVTIRKKERNFRDRLLPTNWNYNKEVNIVETETEGYAAAVRAVTEKSNVTLVFSVGRDPKHLFPAKIDASAIPIHIPDDKEKLHSMEYARSIVNGNGKNSVRNSIHWHILRQQAIDPESFDDSKIAMGIVGSNIARISNRSVPTKVSDEELSQGDKFQFYVEMGGAAAGYNIMTEQTDVSQEDVNIFVKNILTALKEPEEKTELNDETHKLFNISELIAVGETGVGIAGAIAGQALNFDTVTMQALNKYEHTFDNETLSGKKVKDMPSLVNYLNLGIKEPISKDELVMQIDYARSVGEAENRVGLTDKQVLVLYELGFSNSDILTMVKQAEVNGIKIKESPVETAPGQVTMSGSEGLLELIQMCQEGYGIDVDVAIDRGHIIVAESDVEKMLNNERRNGIGVVTVANPLYPAQLRNFQGYTSFTEEMGAITADGASSFGLIRNEIKEERPAILRFKGNIEALNLSAISVIGNESSSEEARRIARNLTREISDTGVAIVTSIRRTSNISHSRKVSVKELMGQEYAEDKDLKDFKPTKITARNDSETAARQAAIDAGAPTIVITPNGLNYKEDADQINAVVASGGIVLSEAGFEAEESSERLHVRAGYLACAMGNSVILVDGKDPDFGGINPSDELSAAQGKVFVVRHPGAEGAHPEIKGNEALIQAGAAVIEASGKGLEVPVAMALASSEDIIKEDVKANLEVEKEKESVKEDKKENKYVDRFDITVVRKGSDQVFIVPEEYAAVRDALRHKYGENIAFSDRLGQTKRNMTKNIVDIFDERVSTFSGYEGTEPLRDPTYTVPLFYIGGEIYSLYNAPTDKKLENIKKRIQNRDLLDQLKGIVNDINGEYMTLLDLPENTKLRFQNAYYIVTTQNAVEIYEGAELRASVKVDHRGKLLATNYEPIMNSLRESNPEAYVFDDKDAELLREKERQEREPFFNDAIVIKDLQSDDLNHRRAAIKALGDKIHEKLIGLDRGAENLSVAADDIKAGLSAGTLTEPGKDEFDRTKAIAILKKEESATQKDIVKMIREKKRASGELESITAERDAAAADALSPSQIADIDERLEESDAKLKAINDTLTKLLTKMAILREHIVKIIMAEKVLQSKSESSGKDEKVTLFVDGLPVDVLPGRIRKNTPEEMKAVSDFIEETRKGEEAKRVAFEEGIEQIENRNVTLENIGKLYDQKHPEAEKGKADRREILPDSFLNGRYIIVRDGKMAYADENLNIRSDFYDKLSRWNGHHGVATNDGKSNFIAPDGKPVVEIWFDTRQKASEGAFVVTAGDDKGIVDDHGKLFGGRLFANARDCHDGWCVVQAGTKDGELAGKFNYINKEGKYISRSWFDQASDFANGEARAMKDGKEFKLTPDGKKEQMSRGRGRS